MKVRKLVVGLGNPGSSYANTRHNVGFLMVDYLINQLGLTESKYLFHGECYFYSVNPDLEIIFVKPQTYMNLSGQCVGGLVRYYQIDVSDVLIIYDEINLLLGNTKYTTTGSAGGHNGMKSVIEHLKTPNISRFRIGIGPKEGELVKFVLAKFDIISSNKLRAVLSVSCERIYQILGLKT